ncbi:MAG: DNA primase [Bacteroidia bacterium]
MIARHSIDQVLESAPIEDVVGQYLTLKRRGVNMIGLCPFHDEKTPSFNVNPTRGIYKCFGCGKGGNAIQFVMDVEQLPFAEAVRQLAKRFGVELAETGLQEQEEEQEAQRQRENLFAALAFAGDYFVKQLQESEKGKAIALEYFYERGFTTETIRRWELGYADENWSGLLDAAVKAGLEKEVLASASLVKQSESGRWFDMFRNRVMFPIHSVNGRIVAFAGRLMGKAEGQPKYVNSAESPVYHKSDHLFGLFQARNSIKKADRVYLTEGYTDVITLAQAGIENVVASSGTALTENQIRLLRRFTSNVTVLYDGDQAGIKASMRGIDLLLKEDLNVRVVLFPQGEDPDSYCRNLGGPAFAEFLQKTEKNFILFKADLLFADAGNDPIRRAEAIRDILQSLALIRDTIKRVELLKELAGIAGQSQETLLYELNRIVRGNWQKDGEDTQREIDRIAEQAQLEPVSVSFSDEHQERGLLAFMIRFGTQRTGDEEPMLWEIAMAELNEGSDIVFNNPLCARTFDALRSLHAANEPLTDNFFTVTDDTELSSFVSDVLSRQYTLSDAWAKNDIQVLTEAQNALEELTSIFNHLRRKKVELTIQDSLSRLAELGPDEDWEQLLEYQMYLMEKRRELTEPLGTVVTNYTSVQTKQ